MTVALVCGGRKFGDLASLNHNRSDPIWPKREREYKFIMRTMGEILHPQETITDDIDTWLPRNVTIIAGDSTGADSVAIDWAVVNWCLFKEFKADWNRYGLAAGPLRNQQMLDEGKPDLVIAFPGGNGTADMIRRSERAGIFVRRIEWQSELAA